MLRELVSSQGCGAPGGGNPFALLARESGKVRTCNDALQPFRRTGVSEFVAMMGEERTAMGYETGHELRYEMELAGMMPMHEDGVHHSGGHMPISHHRSHDGWAHNFEDDTFEQESLLFEEAFQHRAPMHLGNMGRATMHASPRVSSAQAGSAWAAQMRVQSEASQSELQSAHVAEMQHNAWHESSELRGMSPPEWVETFEGNPMFPTSAPRHRHNSQGRSLQSAAFHHPPFALAGTPHSKAAWPSQNICLSSSSPSKLGQPGASWHSDPIQNSIQSSIQSSTSRTTTAIASKFAPTAGGGAGNEPTSVEVRLQEGARRRIAALESILCTTLGGMALDAQQSSEGNSDAKFREGFQNVDRDGVQCGRTGESAGLAAPQQRTGPSSFECQDCGVTVQGASKDPNQCAYGLNRQGRRNCVCCVCALNHGWTKMYGFGCRQCKARAGFAVGSKVVSASEFSGEGSGNGLGEAHEATFGMEE